MSVASRFLLLNADNSCWRLFVGAGRSVVSFGNEAVESLLPSRTVHEGPPSWARVPNQQQVSNNGNGKGICIGIYLTATTESRAATARMSAQETIPGHTASTCALMLLTTVKPLGFRLKFGPWVCSPDVSFSRRDASQPWMISRVQIFLATLLQWSTSYIKRNFDMET